MRIPSWAFALLRFGIITLIYLHFGARYNGLFGQPLLYYGLPFLMLFAMLGLHRYWMFALGTLLLCTSLAQLAPEHFEMHRFRYFILGLVAFFTGFTPCDRDFAVRALWNKNEPKFFEFRAEPGLTWNMYRFLVCALYARYLFMKTNPVYFEADFIIRNITVDFWGAEFLYQPWFGPACVALAVFLYVINFGLAAGVWFPRHYGLFVSAGLFFSTVNLILARFQSMPHFLFLLLLIPFAAVQRVDRPLTVHQGIPVSF